VPTVHRILYKKSAPSPGLCILVENGVLCPKPIASRGLCGKHRAYLMHSGQLEKFGLPHQPRKRDLRRNPNPVAGLCMVIENGNACAARARPNGLCNRHYQNIWQRPDLKLEDFTAKQEIVYARNGIAKPGKCVVREQAADGRIYFCDEVTHVRGLCRSHYRKFILQPELLNHIANPIPVQSVFRLKRRPETGVCVIVENDVGCSAEATRSRRVCDKHFLALRRAGKIHELTDAFLTKKMVLERKASADWMPGFCIMSVNGVPCTNIPKRRGLCNPCIHLIEKNGLLFEDFALAMKRKKQLAMARKSVPIKGVCVAIENGHECGQAAVVRGLCQAHYKLAKRMNLLAKIALSNSELLTIPDVPNFYLDKNVVIRFAFHELFRTTPDPSSVKLVEAVLQRKVRATVSADCIRAAYSHVSHRLARLKDSGGKEMDEREADTLASQYVGNLFFGRNGFWHVLPVTGESFKVCTQKGMLPNLTLEDALEVHLFAQAKQQFGATMFVTADGGILQYGLGVHPEKIVSEYRETFSRK
jgi:hypothetical protein